LASRKVVGVVVVVLLVLAAGAAGNKVTWGAKNAARTPGVAVLHDARSGYAGFQGDGEETAAFNAKTVSWDSPRSRGEGRPPCLREEQQPAQVEAGVMWVNQPNGGSKLEVVWLQCL
jgi:hypothetical protein